MNFKSELEKNINGMNQTTAACNKSDCIFQNKFCEISLNNSKINNIDFYFASKLSSYSILPKKSDVLFV